MKRSWIVVTLCFSAIVTASPAIADCSRPRSSLTALKHSDVVFRGTVREVKRAGPLPLSSTVWHSSLIVTLDVSRVWKGHVGKQFVLHIASAGGPDDAYREFARGREYLVFALRNSPETTALFHVAEPTYGATGCGGTTSELWGMTYLLDLGPGASPQ
jgi:hypothetical protein